MSTSISHKQRERFLLEQFAERAGLSIEVLEERESPDFVIDWGGEKIGVELTELCTYHGRTGSPLKARESTASRIVSMAQRIYQEAGGPPAHVSICFSPAASLKDLNREVTARRLATFVRNLNLTCWQRVENRSHDLEEADLPEEISFVHALGVPHYEIAHWAVADAGWAVPLSVGSLQARIDEKAERIQEYKKVAAMNWLVIVSDGMKPSQMFHTPAEFDPTSIVSPFDRTFYFGYPERPPIELAKE